MILESLSVLCCSLSTTHLGRPTHPRAPFHQMHQGLCAALLCRHTRSPSRQATSPTWTTNWLFPRLHLTRKSVPCLMVSMTLDVWLVR